MLTEGKKNARLRDLKRLIEEIYKEEEIKWR